MKLAGGCAFAALMALAFAARAQFAEILVPDKVSIATPFYAEITLVCPPAGEGPPRRGCDGLLTAFFELSDHTAKTPADPVLLLPNVAVRWGPIVLHRPGRQSMTLLTEGSDFPGEFVFLNEVAILVEPPGWRVRRK